MAEAHVKLRIGNQEVLVTPQDARALESDLMLLGNHYIDVDWLTMIGRRVDPATVTRTKPQAR